MSKFSRMPTFELDDITHPLFVLPDKEADYYTFRHNYKPYTSMLQRIKLRFHQKAERTIDHFVKRIRS